MINIVCDPLELWKYATDGANYKLWQPTINERLSRKILTIYYKAEDFSHHMTLEQPEWLSFQSHSLMHELSTIASLS